MMKLIKLTDDWYVRADAIEEVLVKRYEFNVIDKCTYELVIGLEGAEDYILIETFETKEDAQEYASNFVHNINEVLAS